MDCITNNNNNNDDGLTNIIDRKRTMEAASNNTWESKATTKRVLPMTPPKFTVTYSRLCDGGAQEMSTAVSCLREIFPNAIIRTIRRTPDEDVKLRTAMPDVVISNSINNNPNKNTNTVNETVLWSSKQKNLYEKYPKKRKKSMKDIRKSLKALKLSRESSNKTPEPTTRTMVQTTATSVIATAATTPTVHEVSEDFFCATEAAATPTL